MEGGVFLRLRTLLIKESKMTFPQKQKFLKIKN